MLTGTGIRFSRQRPPPLCSGVPQLTLWAWVEARGFSPALHRKAKKPSMSWAFSFVWRRGRDSNPQTYDPAPLQAAINQSLTQFTRPEAAPSGARFVLILS